MLRLMFALLIISSPAASQNQDANWYFGYYGGIQFTEGEPQDIGPGPFDVDEGSGTISDEDGNLLFSTSGEVVFDSNNNPMPNGTGLAGNSSSTQNVVIVPFPGDEDNRFFYIFTVAAQLNNGQAEDNGLEYVVVDMAENDGLGDVVQSSTELLPNTAEKIHATYHQNLRDVWVVVHELGSDAFYAYLVTCEGIQDPVVSNTGSVHQLDEVAHTAMGALKISPNGLKIANTFNHVDANGAPLWAYLEFGNFNPETGEVVITDSIEKEDSWIMQGYGLEFSPDNSKLYWSRHAPVSLFQYYAQSPISESETQIAGAAISAYSGMQLGPDGRIYIARSNGANYLSRIENPNDDGSEIILTEEAVQLTNLSKLGLPNNWMYPYPEPEVIVDESTVEMFYCEGSSIILTPDETGVDSYLWNTGESTPFITVSSPGFYSVELIIACQTVVRNFMVESVAPPDYELSADRTLCSGDSLLISVESTGEVVWENGQATSGITVSEAGIYNVQISNDECEVTEYFEVVQLDLPEIDIDSGIEKCISRSVWIHPQVSNATSVSVDDRVVQFPFEIVEPGNYSLSAENTCGLTYKMIEVEEMECTCSFYLPNAFTPNGDGLNDLYKGMFDCEPIAFEMKIFNRWGELVFSTNDPETGWNGEMHDSGYFSPDGVYTFSVKWESRINNVIDKQSLSGHVTLIR